MMIKLTMPITQEFAHILTKDALDFVGKLVEKFQHQQIVNLEWRKKNQAKLLNGERLDFLPNTRQIRESEWAIPPIFGKGLVDRRVEITGPASSRKMVINALNSGAKVFMADAEDSESPTWQNIIQGQVNLYDAARETITYHDSDSGKNYKLNLTHATLMFRPRGLHLFEHHAFVDNQYLVSASLFDFGLYFYHNSKELINRGFGPYFYLPKIEHYEEAAWWTEVFVYAEKLLGITSPTIKATVLIETIPAVFQMDEILFVLKNYSAGLNCGRWDYIFSFIKKLGHNPKFLMPDRSQIGMDQHFLKSYAELLVNTCHWRGVHAIGGMSAYIPIKSDAALNDRALAKVREDKLREVKQGFDGTWVAHPGLVLVARDIFDQYMPWSEQLHAYREDLSVTAEDLLQAPQGYISEVGILTNIRVAITYIESWLRGNGCVPIDHLMEDLATAEISRIQLWQWLHHRVTFSIDDTTPPVVFDANQFEKMIDQALLIIARSITLEKMLSGRYAVATQILRDIAQRPEPPEFLSTYLMQTLVKLEDKND